MTTMLAAAIGAKALHLMLAWLFGAAVSAWIAGMKGRHEKAGLATGLLLSFFGPLIWLVVPAARDSRWRREGWTGRGLALVGAALAFISLMIFPLYEGVEGAQAFVKPEGAAEGFDILALIAILALFVPIAATGAAAGAGPASRPRGLYLVSLGAAAVAVVLILLRLVSPPDVGGESLSAESGLIAALIAAIACLIGEIVNLLTLGKAEPLVDPAALSDGDPAPAGA